MFGSKKYTATTQGTIVGMCLNAHNYNSGRETELDNGVKVSVSIGISSAGGGSSRYPVFEYTVDGQTNRKASGMAHNYGSVKKKIGSTVEVRYNPADPADAKMKF